MNYERELFQKLLEHSFSFIFVFFEEGFDPHKMEQRKPRCFMIQPSIPSSSYETECLCTDALIRRKMKSTYIEYRRTWLKRRALPTLSFCLLQSQVLRSATGTLSERFRRWSGRSPFHSPSTTCNRCSKEPIVVVVRTSKTHMSGLFKTNSI